MLLTETLGDERNDGLVQADTLTLRLRGSNATLIQSFNKYRDIPQVGSGLAEAETGNWCPGEDSNFHDLSVTST